MSRHRSRNEEKLHIRQRSLWPGLQKSREPTRKIAGHALPEQISARQFRRDPIEPHLVVECPRLSAAVADGGGYMILQVLADRGKRQLHLDVIRAKLVRVAY